MHALVVRSGSVVSEGEGAEVDVIRMIVGHRSRMVLGPKEHPSQPGTT
jgi:hypothetical protein